MSLIKLPFLFSSTVATYVTLTPPMPPAPHHERTKDISLHERIFSALVRIYTGGMKLLICSGGILEMAVIVANKYPAYPLSQKILHTLIRGSVTLASRIDFSPMFLVGCGFATVGGFIRYQCYRTLGRLFTFEISIRDNHQLVTSGPYAYVRHPSYTSAVVCCVGMGICCASPGSWLKECGILDTLGGRIASAVYGAMVVYGTTSLVIRAPQEDAMLRKEFGEQWEEWAKKVPYRMIPFIY